METIDNRELNSRIREIVKEELEKRVAGDESLPYYSLLEKSIRIEEELKAQRELISQVSKENNKRFEDLIHYVDKRFEDMNKRFTQLTWLITLMTGFLSFLITLYRYLP
ncbi:MAG: hypothetical protein DRG20_03390 [Deltaproteobacteria bacterium]|nr:MAG: hypothetical protein DRG20_03390 [Deltaproteobacteria bacterium]